MDKLAIASNAALGFVRTALAQQPAPQQPVRAEQPAGDDKSDQVTFKSADRNKDGVNNPEEGNAIDGFDFSRADTNDGEILSRQEFQAAMATSTPRDDGQPELRDGDRTAQVGFDRADTDRNGVLSNEEANDRPGQRAGESDLLPLDVIDALKVAGVRVCAGTARDFVGFQSITGPRNQRTPFLNSRLIGFRSAQAYRLLVLERHSRQPLSATLEKIR
jgi:hypothetical protein